jgi:hypothetical protein
MRHRWKARVAAAMALAALGGILSGCEAEYVHSPWMNTRAEQAKKTWVSPLSAHQNDEMRTRLMTTQTDR